MAPCIVICHFPLPAPSEEQLIEIAKKSASKFRQLGGRGLISKDYVRNEHGAGGVYVWESRAAAQAWAIASQPLVCAVVARIISGTRALIESRPRQSISWSSQT